MAPDVQALLEAMRDLESLLKQSGEEFWSVRVRRAADTVARSDALGLTQFLGLFGGAGSLTDVVLHQNGRLLQSEDERLDILLSNAWGLANQLKRAIE